MLLISYLFLRYIAVTYFYVFQLLISMLPTSFVGWMLVHMFMFCSVIIAYIWTSSQMLILLLELQTLFKCLLILF